MGDNNKIIASDSYGRKRRSKKREESKKASPMFLLEQFGVTLECCGYIEVQKFRQEEEISSSVPVAQ